MGELIITFLVLVVLLLIPIYLIIYLIVTVSDGLIFLYCENLKRKNKR